MIIRIVRMHFTEPGVDEFLKIFEANKIAIRNVKGCTHLQLLKDVNDPLIYTSLSHWESAHNLEDYRKSELFERVWVSVKLLFSAKPQAFSLIEFIKVDSD